MLAWLAAAATLLLGGSAAQAYTFGEPHVRQFGPEVRMYDWTTQKCSDDDIPDQPTRAFRDVNNQVVVVNSHHTTRRWQGSSLASVTHSCSIMMGSGKNTDPSKYDDREWLATLYTPDGRTVYGIIHSEYQGYNHGPGYCIRPGESFTDKAKCWYNTLTLTVSTNNGATFSHATPPNHYVAGPPYQYATGIGPIGFFQPSNIVRGKDGYYYLTTHTQDHGVQPFGSCLMRTKTLDDPASWRAWDGTGFNRRFRDPYRFSYPPEEGVCEFESPQIGTLSESLTWSTYLKKWVLVGASENADGQSGPGFYYFTSDDMLHWSQAKLLMNGEIPWTYQCSDGPEQLRDPSLLDNDSNTRNFETIGQRPFLYFTRFNVTVNSPTSCSTSLDRDLIRIPIEFSNQQPGGPTATLTASTQAPQTGEEVNFDASGSSDADGSITTYKWDLDGDGVYERDTGTNPETSKAYSVPDKVTVTVRVCDDDGKGTDETTVLDVAGAEVASQAADGPVSANCPLPPGGGGGGGGTPGGGTPGGGTPGGGSGGGSAGSGAQGGGSTQGAGPVATPAVVQQSPMGLFRLVGKPATRANGSVVMRVFAPSAGELRVRARGRRAALRPVRAIATKRGTVKVTVRLSKAGKKLLRRRSRAKVKATLVFTPVGGAPQKATRVLTLKRAR